jgi:SAM-dependent methyltransferase
MSGAPGIGHWAAHHEHGVKMLYSRFDRAVRKFIPSVGKMSYNPIVRAVGDKFAYILSLPFSELQDLPPNHLRIRIGVGNRIFANHVHFLQMGSYLWLNFLSHQYCGFNSDVVELGCGCGRVAYPLKADWFKGTYVGVDIDKEMIEYCRKNFSEKQFRFVLSPHKSSTYSSGEQEKRGAREVLTIADPDSKDFVYSISLYSHLLEDEVHEYLRETFRILRTGGVMYMTFFCIEHVKLGERWTFGHRQGSALIEDDKYPEAAVAYHEVDMVELTKQVGFREVSVIPREIQSVLIARK